MDRLLSFTATALLIAAVPAAAQQRAIEPQPAAWTDAPAAQAQGGVIPAGRYDSLPSENNSVDVSRANRYQASGRALSSAASEPRTFNSAPRPSTASAPTEQRLAPVVAVRVDRAKVSKGSGKLPNDSGQVWREYDIRPYTMRAGEADGPKPQQTIVDWILRETGYEAWHSETFGILNANRDTLTVYHTPAMQAIVADIVDRFVNSRGAERAFSMRIATVRNPDWRVRALPLMTPITVQSPGLQGWIMPKENYALLLSELGKRSDLREYNAANQAVGNGRSIVFSTMRPRGYIKGVVSTQNTWPGYQPEMGQLEEGASLEFNPLLSLDMRTAEAVVKLRMNQVEKMRPVNLDFPGPATAGGRTQRLQIEVPQLTMANLHERFRWPAEQVLVLSMGLVATPGPEQGNPLTDMLPSALKDPPRADALLFVEARNVVTPSAGPNGRPSTASRSPATFRGRY